MALSTPGLDRLDAMQRNPIGTFSALRRPSPVASQWRRQSEMYGQALRNLSRAARRGDAGAAMDAIKVREDANANGFTPGGIGRSEDKISAITGREQSLMRSNDIAQREDRFNRSTLDRRLGSSMERPQTTTNPALNGYDSSTPAAPGTRTSAALDMLEGALGTYEGGDEQLFQGRKAAEGLGVQNPDSILSGDRNLKYRQTLDSALGQAKTPEEIAALKARGTKFGISANAFDRRARWWDSNR